MSKRMFQMRKPSNRTPDQPEPSGPTHLHELPDGAHPMSVTGGVFVKEGNIGKVIVGLHFDDPEYKRIRIDVVVAQFDFNPSKIIVPGLSPSGLRLH